MTEDFVAHLKKLKPDVQVVAEVWPKLGERDFTPHINALLQAKPEMVFSAIWGGDHIAFVKQAKPYGFFAKTQYLAIGQGDLDVVVPLGAEAPEGMWVSSNYTFYYPDAPANRDFVAKYKARTGDLPPSGAAFGYTATQFLAAAIRKAKSTETEKVVEALEGLTMETVHGPLDHPGLRPSIQQGTVLRPAQEGARASVPDHRRPAVRRRREDDAHARRGQGPPGSEVSRRRGPPERCSISAASAIRPSSPFSA